LLELMFWCADQQSVTVDARGVGGALPFSSSQIFSSS